MHQTCLIELPSEKLVEVDVDSVFSLPSRFHFLHHSPILILVAVLLFLPFSHKLPPIHTLSLFLAQRRV